MKERGILYRAQMVLAILNTLPNKWPAKPIEKAKPFKWQTRRPVKPQPKHTDTWTTLEYFRDGFAIEHGPDYPDDDSDKRHCPYGVEGDRLWTRETWGWSHGPMGFLSKDCWLNYRADLEQRAFDGRDIIKQIGKFLDRPGKWRPGIHMFRWASRINQEIKRIRVERLQDITNADAIAEGFSNREAFRDYYIALHNKEAWDSNQWVWVLDLMRL